MIELCPHCGHHLKHPIQSGIGSCSNCHRVFDSSPYYRLLSAAWMTRKWNLACEDNLVHQGFTQAEAETVIEQIYDKDLCHEEFIEFLVATGVSKVITIEPEGILV